MTIAQLNAAEPRAFMDAVGFAFEDSPWIAQAAMKRRPFGSVRDLHAAMVAIVRESPEDRRVALISAHPDLAGRVAREGRLTPASRDEQASAGLDTLSATQLREFDGRNSAYRERFGFPFVICAREQTADSIVASLGERLKNSREQEIETALGEIAKIARLRLSGVVSDS